MSNSRQVQAKIDELAKLPNDWDGYGSPTPTEVACLVAQAILAYQDRDDAPDPSVSPCPGGGLQLLWARNGIEADIEILADGSIEYLLVESESLMHEGKLPKSAYPAVAGLVSWMIDASAHHAR